MEYVAVGVDAYERGVGQLRRAMGMHPSPHHDACSRRVARRQDPAVVAP